MTQEQKRDIHQVDESTTPVKLEKVDYKMGLIVPSAKCNQGGEINLVLLLLLSILLAFI
jgi:hypothetical protein